MADTPGGKGIMTTEFMALIAMFAVVVANGTVHINIPTSEMNMLIGLGAAYIGQRGYVKGKAKP